MNNEGAFTRLVDLIGNPKSDAKPGLHRLFMELLYEMARIQRIKIDDLSMSMLLTLLRGRPGAAGNPSTEADPSSQQYTLMTLLYGTYFRS